MSRVTELIDLIVQGKNAEASEVLNTELLGRSYQAVNDLKPEVASQYFAPVVGEPEVSPEVQPEVTTDETDS
ncbi:hypothetical protein [Synechococcus phage S-B68]|nr:hypothetical protein [Synechococcus phage S-B68]